MFDDLKEYLFEYWLVAFFGIIVLIITLAMIFKPSAIQGVETHDMGNGVTCYTFNTSIDCLQIGR